MSPTPSSSTASGLSSTENREECGRKARASRGATRTGSVVAPDPATRLKEPSARPNKLKGPLPLPLVSLKKFKDNVVHKVVALADMEPVQEAWIRKWLSSHKDVPIEAMEGPVLKGFIAPVPTPPPPPSKKRNKQKEVIVEPEPEAEDISLYYAEQTVRTSSSQSSTSKRLWQYIGPPDKWEWDATPRSVLPFPSMTSPRWSLPPVLSAKKWSATSSLASPPRSPKSSRTPPTSHRYKGPTPTA